jgi:hypothetical protein
MAVPKSKSSLFNFIETSNWYLFGVALFALAAWVWLFRDFFFSTNIILFGSDWVQTGPFFRWFLVNGFSLTGHVPGWNPYIFGGLPFVDAFHGDLFYPISWLFKMFGDDPIGMNIWINRGVVFHIPIAGLLMYLAARSFDLGRTASLFSALAYMFAPYFVSLIAPYHDGKMYVTALFPGVMWCLQNGFAATNWMRMWFWFSVLGIFIGVVILTPHPQMSYYVLWVIGVFSLYKLIRGLREKVAVSRLGLQSALIGISLVAGLGLSAIQFQPGYEYTNKYSPRAEGGAKTGWDWSTSWSMHPEEAVGLVIPEFAGVNTERRDTAYWGRNAFKDNSESAGVVALFLAVIGVSFYRRRDTWIFVGIAFACLIYALGATTPIYYLFYYLVPKVDSLRAPSMIMFVFAFCVALLAGYGVNGVMESVKSKGSALKRFNYVVWGVPAFLFLLALLFTVAGKGLLGAWCSIFYSEAPTQMVQQGMSKLDVGYFNLSAIQSGAWFAFLFTAIAATCISVYRSGQNFAYMMVALLAMPVIDNVRFNSRFIHTVDPRPYISSNPITEALTQETDLVRAMSFVRDLPHGLLPLHGIPVVTGYHGNQVRWYDDLLGGPGAPNQTNPRLLNLCGATHIVIPTGQQIPPGYFGPLPSEPLMSGGSVTIIRNMNAFPRAFFVDRFEVMADVNSIKDAVLTGSENLRHVAFLEEEPGVTLSADSSPLDSARVLPMSDNGFAVTDSVRIAVSASSDRILVLSDVWYDAWTATADGKPTKVLRADYAFRAIVVPAGTKEVMFRYQSTRYESGKFKTQIFGAYLALVLGAFFVLSRRKPNQQVIE